MFPELEQNRTISVVIPTRNEEQGIRETLKEIPLEEFKDRNFNCEIIVVDGNSEDATREIAEKFGAKVIQEQKPGYGLAYKKGFSIATGEVIATLDGDFSYSPIFIPRLLDILERENLDFVSGNRFGRVEEGAMNRVHVLGTKLLNLAISMLFFVNLKDSQSGMWIFRKKTLERIMIHSDGMPFSEELKIRAFRELKAKETPIAYRQRIGRPKLNTFRDGFRNIIYLLRLRFSRRTFGV